MLQDPLTVRTQPKLREGKMILAFSGWMDGGDVSTGTVKWLVNALDAEEVAEIDPEGHATDLFTQWAGRTRESMRV